MVKPNWRERLEKKWKEFLFERTVYSGDSPPQFLYDALQLVRTEHFEGIRRWSEMAWKRGLLKKEQWTGDDEVTASIQSYANGNDLSSNSKEDSTQ